MRKIKKIKTIPRQAQDSFYNVDPTGFKPVFPLVKGGVLSHKLQARVHARHIKTKKALLQELSLLTSGIPTVYVDSTFCLHYITPQNYVNSPYPHLYPINPI